MAVKSQNGTLPMPYALDIEDLSGADIFTTQRGFKLKIVPVPADIIAAAQDRIPRPQPPLIDEPGSKVILANEKDPKYIRDLEEYYRIRSDLNFQVAAAYGIQAYHVPEGFYGPDDDAWERAASDDEIFSVEGTSYAPSVPPKDKPRARFTAWLRLYVLTASDSAPIFDALMHGLGHVTETDVEEAVESFPSQS